MVFDLTYDNRQANLEIDKLIGKPFGVFNIKRWSGIGSERLIVKSAEGKLGDIFKENFRQNFANIEIRPKGILIRVRYRLEVFAVAIPFGQLSVFKTDPNYFSLFGGTEKITLTNYQGRSFDQKFLNKILAAKAEYYQEHHAH